MGCECGRRTARTWRLKPSLGATVALGLTLLCCVPAEVDAKGETDRLTHEALKALVNKPELLALTESLTPEQTVAFWMPESEMEALELELGVGVRLKTRGDSPFLGEQRSPHCGLLAPWLRLSNPCCLELMGTDQVWPPQEHNSLRFIPKSLDGCLRHPRSWGAAQSHGSWGSHPGSPGGPHPGLKGTMA